MRSRLKFMFLIEDYNLFYTRYYSKNPNIHDLTFEEQRNRLLGELYYQTDSYAQAMRELGHVAETIIPDCNQIQQAWLRENNLPLSLKWKAGRLKRSLKSRLLKDYNTFQGIRMETLSAQVEKSKPDVLFVYSGVKVDPVTMQEFSRKGIMLVLHWSCPILPGFPYDCFDLIVTSARELKNEFTQRGYNCIELQQAFDPRTLLNSGKPFQRDIDLSFVGNFIKGHSQLRIQTLESLALNTNVKIWGGGTESLPPDSPILKKHFGRTGGLEMFDIFRRSKISLHLRNDSLAEFAGAKRYFEVTGAGTLLLAFHQQNIQEFFEPGKEIVTFTSEAECQEKIHYFLAHDKEREAIAKAGQERTLREHTFLQRAPLILMEIEKYLEKAKSRSTKS